jgi:hypothetical protein
MIAEIISLDILSLPSVLAAVGMIPGIVTIAGLGILVAYWVCVCVCFSLVLWDNADKD